jgi:hypothetical protein
MWLKYLWTVVKQETERYIRIGALLLVTVPNILSAPVIGRLLRAVGVTWAGIPLRWSISITLITIGGLLVWTLTKRAHRLDEQRKPRLMFRMAQNMGDTNPETNVSHLAKKHPIYRVRIINNSDVTIRNVTAMLESTGSDKVFHDLPTPLHLGTKKLEKTDLLPRQQEYVNIAFFDGDLEEEDAKRNKITFCTSDPTRKLTVPLGVYEASIKVFAEDAPPVSSVFRITAARKPLSYFMNTEWVSGWESDDEMRKIIQAQDKTPKLTR